MPYKRILIKLSGEGLVSKDKNLAIDYQMVKTIALQIKKLLEKKIQIALVVGGGNFWRGISAEKNGISRNRADYIGMLATIMNGLALQSGFESLAISARVMSSLEIDQRICEKYVKEKADNYLKSGKVVIFVGGTGRPFFTTDTASALFASEIEAEIILMGKNGVDGVYDCDPKIHENAIHYPKLKYEEIISKNLKVMDLTSVTMCQENKIKLLIFNIKKENAILEAIEGKIKKTLVGF